MKLRSRLLFLVVFAIAGAGSAGDTPWRGLVPGPYGVGFRTLDLTDYGRTVGPLVDWRGAPRTESNFRRIMVSVWYPAESPVEGEPMLYRDYVAAAGFATSMDGDLLTGVDAYLAHSLFGGADESRLRRMVEEATTAVRDAPPAEGRFPPIVYAPSFSYEPFENAALFEYLASHGFVVASSRSSGPETREMAFSLDGVEASVRDLESILAALANLSQVDLERVGAGGFSWGGLSAAMLGMRNHNVRAVLALDGTLEHAEIPSVEDLYSFRPRRLRGGYLAIVGDREPVMSLVETALYTDLVELRYPDLSHWDFASDMIRISTHAAAEPDATRIALVDSAYALIAHQARLLFAAYLKGDDVSRRALLAGETRAKDPSIVVETRAAREAKPAPPSSAEFAALLAEDLDAATELLARSRANDPGIELLDWMQLQGVISVSPFETKLAILDLVRKELGESSIYFNNLGQAWRMEGEPAKALVYFRQALEHNPDSGFARRSIAELETSN
jgi:dienelactone hydrolase